MHLYDVYPLFNIEPVRAQGCTVYDKEGREYLDLYGGHAVISIGHSHPWFVDQLQAQTERMIFYSNSVQNPIQQELADKLGQLSGCDDYELFLCNSGAEAMENALKLASFATGRSAILAIKNAFHGRTSAAVNITDNEKIKAPINKGFPCTMIAMNDEEALQAELSTGQYAAVVVETIQGVGGLDTASPAFLKAIEANCKTTGTLFVADEIQCGYGRSGRFFAFQHAGVAPHLITMAKGMGNGFPIGGVLIAPGVMPAAHGLLGTTFGGNHLSCVAGLAVLTVMEQENLTANAAEMGAYLREQLQTIPEVKAVKGMGLMSGPRFDFPVGPLRERLLYHHHIFTGNAKDPNVLRLLPPLKIGKAEIDTFIAALKAALSALVI